MNETISNKSFIVIISMYFHVTWSRIGVKGFRSRDSYSMSISYQVSKSGQVRYQKCFIKSVFVERLQPNILSQQWNTSPDYCKKSPELYTGKNMGTVQKEKPLQQQPIVSQICSSNSNFRLLRYHQFSFESRHKFSVEWWWHFQDLTLLLHCEL